MGNKVVKYISTVFYCVGAGGIILYIYNLFVNSQKYEYIPKDIVNIMQLYLIIGIAAILLGIIIKLLANIIKNKRNIIELKDDQKECKNCKAIISKDSYICPNCGYIEPKEDEQVFEEDTIDKEYINKYYNDDIVVENKDKQALVIRVLPKIFLIVFIILCIYFVYLFALDSKTINKVADKKLEFLNIAINITSEINFDDIKTTDKKVYLTLLELDYESDKYDSKDSYIIIDTQLKEYYLILNGINEYSDYSINFVEVNDLNISKVLTDYIVTKDINNKLIIDNGDKVIIYNKN